MRVPLGRDLRAASSPNAGPPGSDVLERLYTVGGGGVPPLTPPYLPPLGPPPLLPPPLVMCVADSQNFALAPSVPRGFKLQNFRPPFGGDHRGTEGGGGVPANPPPPHFRPPPPLPPPPSNTSLPPGWQTEMAWVTCRGEENSVGGVFHGENSIFQIGAGFPPQFFSVGAEYSPCRRTNPQQHPANTHDEVQFFDNSDA